MKSTAALLKLYECIYGFVIALVLGMAAFAFARMPAFPDAWLVAALVPLGLLALGVAVCASFGVTPIFPVRSRRSSSGP